MLGGLLWYLRKVVFTAYWLFNIFRLLFIDFFNNFKSELEKYDKCKIIMSTWNNGGAINSIVSGDGLHTYYIEKSKAGEFRAYNYYPNYDTIQNYSSIDAIYSDAGGKFIISYIIEGN